MTAKLDRLLIRVPVKEQILFARNISLMIKTGMPLLDSLQMIQRQTGSSGLRKVLGSVIADIENGQFLSTSLKRYEYIFGALFINIIRVGEVSGTLAENLGFLADELKKKQELKSKIVGALIYPAIIVVTTVALSGILTFAVFPKILPIFKSFDVPLPITTRFLIRTNEIALRYWPWLILLVMVLVGTFVGLMRIYSFRFFVHQSYTRIPIAGPMVRNVQMAIFARTFALLLKSGVKIVEALNITAEIIPNLVYKRVIQSGAEQVGQGAPLGKFLANYAHYFPLMFSQMVEVGETAGTLDTTLAYLATYYEEELDNTTRNMVALLEPLLMLGMGGVVAFIAMSIILPIYQITQTVGQ